MFVGSLKLEPYQGHHPPRQIRYLMLFVLHPPCWLCVALCQVTTDGFTTLASTLSAGRFTWLASKRQLGKVMTSTLATILLLRVSGYALTIESIHPFPRSQRRWEGGMLDSNQEASRLPPSATCEGPLLCDACRIPG